MPDCIERNTQENKKRKYQEEKSFPADLGMSRVKRDKYFRDYQGQDEGICASGQ